MPNYKILIIDYEPRGIEQLREPLRRAGHVVTVAQDGLAGIELFNSLQPDLTLIEAMLPKKHGFEVCQILKASPHGQRSPVVIVTSVYKGRRYRTQAIHNYGCDEYLEKPVPEDKLLEVTARLLKNRVPSTVQPPTPEPSAAAAPVAGSPDEDAAEFEIMQHLDDLLGDSGKKPGG